ncbi:hypothetical protein [Rhodovibrio salinarum]|uniref:Uncharacterized protein n=1 Tax=Rhodovibrio salinarum TaxID=1087 RepID=A0A934UZQ0_9PROT|nr:hypothetical protein [Rhodovibrio salinarum]MBK1697422.1 hypothetical protein [Rhodovibrio salinarum]
MYDPTDPKRSATQQNCRALLTISEDFHTLVQASCPRCMTGTGPCAVDTIRATIAAEDVAPPTWEEAAEPPVLTRH